MNKIESILDQNKKLSKNIEFVYDIEGSDGDYSEISETISSKLKNALKSRGIKKLYSHQAEAWKLSQENKNFAVVTPTASGKTLTYNIPVLEEIMKDKSSKAMYIFPTKSFESGSDE